MINKQIIVGRAGKDPETRTFDNGNMITNLSIATSETWKDKKTGEKKEKTEWHNCVFGGPLADVVANYVKKGDLLYVEGKKETRTYEKDGETKYVVDLRAGQMQMLGGKSESGGKPQSAPVDTSVDEDDIPF